jgi:chromosome segregation ATPase
MKSTGKQFLIRAPYKEKLSDKLAKKEDAHISEYRKRVRESRYESSMVHSEFSDTNTKKKMLKMEETIFTLQDKSIFLAESIEFESRTEDLYDKEIAGLRKTLEELREKKLSYIRLPRDLRTDLAELEQNSKSLKDNVDEMRSKNRLLREKIDNLR